MSIKNGTTLTPEALSYLVGLIRDISGLDTKLIDDLNIKSNGSYSSLKISQLVDQALKDSKEYSDLLCSSLIKLTCEKTTTQPTLGNSQKNVIYLYSSDGNAPFHQYLKISDTELIDLGSTSISLNDYLTITDAVATYCKKTDFDALKTEVTNLKTKVGTDTLNTTSQDLSGGVNELKTDLTSHTNDTDIHITTAERDKWNKKAEIDDTQASADRTYSSNKIEEKIPFKFGIDGEGNYGYFKADDSFVPFSFSGCEFIGGFVLTKSITLPNKGIYLVTSTSYSTSGVDASTNYVTLKTVSNGVFEQIYYGKSEGYSMKVYKITTNSDNVICTYNTNTQLSVIKIS